MKAFKYIFLKITQRLSQSYIKNKKIEVVSITGSAGKTTTRHAIKLIFDGDRDIYVPEENYNTESGIPSAIFQLRNPETTRNILPWCILIFRMILKFFKRVPYKTIVLEFSADKPGDIDYLIQIAKPHIAIVTTIIPAHLEGFGSLELIAREKGTTVRALSNQDFAILNYDNKFVKSMSKETVGKVFSTGLTKSNDLHYNNLKYNETGMALDLFWKDQKSTLELSVVAPHLIPSFLAAIAFALLRGKSLSESTSKLFNFIPEKGRMRLLRGKGDSLIIDDSYNSNPESAKAALDVLSHYKGRKIAVLGSMNELGDFSREGHEQVGELAAKVADEVIIVGEIAGHYLYPVVLKKLNKNIVHRFSNSYEAGEYLARILVKGDVVLVKGSQNGVFSEEAIKYILAEPKQAVDLLVRQGGMWENKKGQL